MGPQDLLNEHFLYDCMFANLDSLRLSTDMPHLDLRLQPNASMRLNKESSADVLDDHDRDLLEPATVECSHMCVSGHKTYCKVSVSLRMFEGLKRIHIDDEGYCHLSDVCNNILIHVSDKFDKSRYFTYDITEDEDYIKNVFDHYFHHKPQLYGICTVTIGNDAQHYVYNHGSEKHLLIDYSFSRNNCMLKYIRVNRVFANQYGLYENDACYIENFFNEQLDKSIRLAKYALYVDHKFIIGNKTYVPRLDVNGLQSACYLEECSKSATSQTTDTNLSLLQHKDKVHKTKFIVGNKYMLRFKSLNKSDTIKKTFVLKKFVYNMKDEPLDIVVMKQIDGPVSSMLFTLSKKDCERIHLKFEPGLQVFPMSMSWINITQKQKQKNDKIH